jgi:hypothetical protein
VEQNDQGMVYFESQARLGRTQRDVCLSFLIESEQSLYSQRSAINRELKKKGRKRGNLRRRRPLFAQKGFHFANFQPDRTEVRDLKWPVSIEKDIAHLHRAMQHSKAQAQFPQLLSLSLSTSTTQADLTEYPPENPESHTIAQF